MPACGGRPDRGAFTIQYRTLLVAFLLCLLAVTLALAFVAWRGAQVALAANERTQLAHEVLGGLLRIRVDTNRLITDLTVVALTGSESGLTEGQAPVRIREELSQVRARIAREVTLLESREAVDQEALELEQLHAVERSIDAIVGEFDAVARLLAAGLRQEAAERIRRAIDKAPGREGVAAVFRTEIQRAIDDEEEDVQRANVLALQALRGSAQATQAAAAGALLLTAVGLVVLLKRLQQPLHRLSASARAVAQGDISSRVEIAGDDEFARVARVINGMLDELQSSRTRLQASQAQLEAQVAERTLELSAANDALRGADAVRRRFLADISHELRTPLTIIRGEAEVALRGREKSLDEYRTTLARVVEQAGQTARLVDDLLFIARTGADQLRMTRQPVAFDVLVRDTCTDTQTVARAQGMSIDYAQRVQSALVRGDPRRLRQMLHVLLDNALRYGQRASTVEVTLDASADGVVLRVVDRGCGIAAADLPNVFERFYRGDNAAEQHPDGSGLGLPMAKAIVEAHDGTIALASVQGQGTTVSVSLPAMRA